MISAFRLSLSLDASSTLFSASMARACDDLKPPPFHCLYLSVKAANPRRLGAIERHPHYVTRRYAHFAASLLALHSGLDDLAVGIGGEEMLLNDLGTLRVEVRREL